MCARLIDDFLYMGSLDAKDVFGIWEKCFGSTHKYQQLTLQDGPLPLQDAGATATLTHSQEKVPDVEFDCVAAMDDLHCRAHLATSVVHTLHDAMMLSSSLQVGSGAHFTSTIEDSQQNNTLAVSAVKGQSIRWAGLLLTPERTSLSSRYPKTYLNVTLARQGATPLLLRNRSTRVQEFTLSRNIANQLHDIFLDNRLNTKTTRRETVRGVLDNLLSRLEDVRRRQ